MAEKQIIITRQEISRRVKELGAEITSAYQQSKLLAVGILNGAFVFMADLIREINVDIEIDFVRVASYGMGTTAGTFRFIKDIELDTSDKDILIVEDIVDTGRTLEQLSRSFQNRGAKSVRFCTLIDKKERREIEDIIIDYVGFEVESGFLVGYGLDCRERFRQLPEIYSLQDE
jgi:hypoxanthine phosphoribosyltransferase